jgi:hypothetical protein
LESRFDLWRLWFDQDAYGLALHANQNTNQVWEQNDVPAVLGRRRIVSRTFFFCQSRGEPRGNASSAKTRGENGQIHGQKFATINFEKEVCDSPHRSSSSVALFFIVQP